jgi:hypothetical protein
MLPARLWFGFSLLLITAVLIAYGLSKDLSLGLPPQQAQYDENDKKAAGMNQPGAPPPKSEAAIDSTDSIDEKGKPAGTGSPLIPKSTSGFGCRIPERCSDSRVVGATLGGMIGGALSPFGPISPRLAPTSSAADERAAIERQLKSIDAQYKVPEQLMYKRSAQVVFVLEVEGKGTAANALAALPGQQATARVSVSRFVRARLFGEADMVKITLRGGEAAERQFAQFKNVEWVWDVEGLKVGQANLNLQLLAEVNVDGKPEPLQIKTFQKTIPIQISFLDSVKVWAEEVMSLWPFLGAVGTGLASLLVFFGFKKPKEVKSDA